MGEGDGRGVLVIMENGQQIEENQVSYLEGDSPTATEEQGVKPRFRERCEFPIMPFQANKENKFHRYNYTHFDKIKEGFYLKINRNVTLLIHFSKICAR